MMMLREEQGMSSTSDEAPVVIVRRLNLSQYTRTVGSEGTMMTYL